MSYTLFIDNEDGVVIDDSYICIEDVLHDIYMDLLETYDFIFDIDKDLYYDSDIKDWVDDTYDDDCIGVDVDTKEIHKLLNNSLDRTVLTFKNRIQTYTYVIVKS